MRLPMGVGRGRSPPVGGLCGVGLFESADLVVGEGDFQGGDGIGEVVGFGGADDGGGHDGLGQQPGDSDLGHRDAALFGHLLDSLDDGLVDVEVKALGDLVGVAALGVLAPGSSQSALAERRVWDAATPMSAHIGSISRSSSRLSRLY